MPPFSLSPVTAEECALATIELISGPPGVGKSTLVSKVVLRLKSAGVIVGGCLTSERRRKGVRVGFGLRDLTNGTEGELASVDAALGPWVGRYRVNLKDLGSIGGKALVDAAASSEAIVIDEVGPMELVSPEFRRGVRACLDSGKPLLAVVHERMEDDLIVELKRAAGGAAEVTAENRDDLAEKIADSLVRAARSRHEGGGRG